MIKEIEFPSEGDTLKGMLFLPDPQKTKPPIIIMAHGFSATMTMVADKYAEVFCRSGLAVLLYDHRNFGRSGGEPRQEINPWVQCRGYRDAINYVETLKDIDSNKIALWGDSYTGRQVIILGAIDERVKAIVAQVPTCGERLPTVEPSKANFETIKETFLKGDICGSAETTTGPIPVVSSDQLGSPSLLKPIQAFRWFVDYGGRAGSKWINRVTRVIPDTPMPFHSVLCAQFVKAPMLMMVAPEDEMVHANYSVSKQVYERLSGPKEWYDISGGHFGLLYYPSELFDEASGVQTKFYKKWL